MLAQSLPPLSPKDILRFWKKVRKTETCWLWTAARSPAGYGFFGLAGKNRLAHRVAFVLCRGEPRPEMQLDHLCRNTSCVNPDHLEPVTPRENLRRSPHTTGNRTKCPQGHAYSGDNVYIKPSGARTCRECDRVRAREFNRRKFGYAARTPGVCLKRRNTHCKHGHAMVDANVYTNPRGSRSCIACQNVRGAAYRQRKKK